jgi:hypothetical protein
MLVSDRGGQKRLKPVQILLIALHHVSFGSLALRGSREEHRKADRRAAAVLSKLSGSQEFMHWSEMLNTMRSGCATSWNTLSFGKRVPFGECMMKRHAPPGCRSNS